MVRYGMVWYGTVWHDVGQGRRQCLVARYVTLSVAVILAYWLRPHHPLVCMKGVMRGEHTECTIPPRYWDWLI